MSELIKTELQGLFRDKSSGALVNRDGTGLDSYKKAKQRNRRISHLEKRFEMLEKKVINSLDHNLLQSILERLEKIEMSLSEKK